MRLTNRQNIAFRDLTEEQIPVLFERLEAIGMAQPGAELARDVVSCPGADTCNLAVTQIAWSGRARSAKRSKRPASAKSAAFASTSRAAPTPAASITSPTSASWASSVGRTAVAAPGYQMLLGGHLADTMVAFGQKALRLPAKNCGEAAVRVIGKYAGERDDGRDVPGVAWSASVASRCWPTTCATSTTSPRPTKRPHFYVDYDETGPYVAEIGESECAT